MRLDDNFPYLAVHAALQVKLQVYPHTGLSEQDEHEPWRKLGVRIRRELPTLMLVAEEVAYDRENGAGRLYGDVPLRSYHAQHHSRGKHDAPGHGLYQDVDP